jgi:hypothetical protein
MEDLKKLLFLEEFEDIQEKIQDSSVNYKATKLLTWYKIDNNIKTKDFLSCFIIYKYPDDILGDLTLEINKKLYDAVNKIFNDSEDNLKTNIIRYVYLFKKWKNEDKTILIDQIFNEYHQLTLDILNCVEEEDTDKIQYFENVKNDILREAENIGGEILKNKILSYTPIVVSVKEFKEQYDHAYWDKMKLYYDNNNYEMILSLLNFYKETFKTLSPFNSEELNLIVNNENIIDNLNKMKNENNDDSAEFIRLVISQLFNIIKTFQSPIHDMELESYKAQIHIGELDFVQMLHNMFILFNKTISDLDNIKNINNNNNTRNDTDDTDDNDDTDDTDDTDDE